MIIQKLKSYGIVHCACRAAAPPTAAPPRRGVWGGQTTKSGGETSQNRGAEQPKITDFFSTFQPLAGRNCEQIFTLGELTLNCAPAATQAAGAPPILA